jgi:hypothetical protein
VIKKQMVTKECFGCGNVTAHRHLHDCAHGIAETHMVGSERFVCELCGHVTRADSDGAERFLSGFLSRLTKCAESQDLRLESLDARRDYCPNSNCPNLNR